MRIINYKKFNESGEVVKDKAYYSEMMMKSIYEKFEEALNSKSRVSFYNEALSSVIYQEETKIGR